MSRASAGAPSTGGRGAALLVAVGVVLCLLALVFPPVGIVPLVVGIARLMRSHVASGIVLVALAAVCGTLGLTVVMPAVLLKPYRAPSASMEPTIGAGERFLLFRRGSPAVGKVVVFHPPRGAVGGGTRCAEQVREDELCPRPAGGRAGDLEFVKRVVAGPGDRLAIRRGRVVLNGREVDEPYVRACEADSGCSFRGEITVPDGHWYMLGDNRGQSDDSRFWGPVPDAWVRGTVVAKYWPPDAVGGL